MMEAVQSPTMKSRREKCPGRPGPRYVDFIFEVLSEGPQGPTSPVSLCARRLVASWTWSTR